MRTAARKRADLARGFASNSAFEDVNERELMIWKLGGRTDSIDVGMWRETPCDLPLRLAMKRLTMRSSKE